MLEWALTEPGTLLQKHQLFSTSSPHWQWREMLSPKGPSCCWAWPEILMQTELTQSAPLIFHAIHCSIAWFSPRSCIQVWLSSLDGHIPKLILKVFHVVWQCFCLQVGLHTYSVMHAWVNCPKYAWTYPKLAPSFNKRPFRGVPLGQSAPVLPSGHLLLALTGSSSTADHTFSMTE